MSWTRRLVAMAALATVLPALAATVHLPVQHYTSADGLVQDQVLRLALDAERFVWIATAGGLSRFDGERFTGFDEKQGLRGRQVNDIAIGRDGNDWAATEAGLFAFRPGEAPAAGGALFREIPLEGIGEGDEPHRLLVATSGAVWVGTLSGLWRIIVSANGYAATQVELHPGRPARERFRARVQSLAEDPTGAIWVGTHTDGFFRVAPDGRVDHCPDTVPGASFVRDFHFAKDGSVWTAYFGGVAIFPRPPFPDGGGPPARLIGSDEGLSIDSQRMLPLSDDRVLVATTTGLTDLLRSRDGRWSVGSTLDRRSGLPGDFVSSIVRDPEGNLWVGLATHGLVKVLASGFATLPDAEMPGSALVDLTTDRRGRLVALASKGARTLTVYHPDGNPAGPFELSLPGAMIYVGWGGNQKLHVDSRGSFWVATGSGVLRYDDPRGEGPRRLTRPADAVFGVADGLPGPDVFVVAEDARGDVWISAKADSPGLSSLARWSRATGKIEAFPESAVGSRSLPAQFLCTREGTVWISFINGMLARHRDGGFQVIRAAPGYESSHWLEDARGHVWVIGRGAYECTDPSAAEPVFARRDVVPGDERAALGCAVESADGRLWFGTSHGIVRFDPATGKSRRFAAHDGLVGTSVALCDRDGTGTLWFSDQSGLSRLTVGEDLPWKLARARLREVRIAGEAIPLPSLGATSADSIVIPSDRRRLAVEFFAVHHGPGTPPRFQYRLEGADTDWSAPTSDRSVQYAHLAPGRYRFEVRTVAEDGTPSDVPAFVPFRAMAPLWLRPWFLAIGFGMAAGIAYGAHRVRVARMIALEKIRTRIATDLHDDIGSSLSQISILSQLARRQSGGGAAPDTLDRITALSGELVDSMSDVVWAISPRWDTVSALVHRMRRFASELFADGDVELTLRLPAGGEAPVDPDVRRQLYLVFKEALHNVQRHSDARSVAVELRRQGAVWILLIEEDGRGFDAARESEGHGVQSMRRRAEALGGRLEIQSSPQGTRFELTLLDKPAR